MKVNLSLANNSYSQSKNNSQKQHFKSTLAIWKPDATLRGLEKPLNAILEKNGFSILQSWKGIAPKAKLKSHYAEHEGKPFFDGLITSMSQGDIVVMEIEKKSSANDVLEFRKLVQEKIRPMFALNKQENTAHSSDSTESATREILNWFPTKIGK